MKKLSILFWAVMAVGALMGQKQSKDPVHFDYELRKVGTGLELHIVATMEEGWHIYAQKQPEGAISVPTKIVFTKNPLLIIDGQPKEIGKKETYTDPNAGIVQYQYGGKLEFVQALKAESATAKTSLTGTITYQACTGEMCLPPKTIPFTVAVQ